MIGDIVFPKVNGVSIAIARKPAEDGDFEWAAYVINDNDFPIVNVLIATKGYGHKEGEPQQTSVLRHLIERLQPNEAQLIERIDPAVFHLVNEFWLSYYLDKPNSDIYDKKYLFVPDSIVEANLSHIKHLDLEGVLHV